MKRYIIKNGKYGAYFFDTKNNKNMTLQEVEDKLNQADLAFELERRIGNEK